MDDHLVPTTERASLKVEYHLKDILRSLSRWGAWGTRVCVLGKLEPAASITQVRQVD